MLSPRVWFERFPAQLRLFVALLCALSFVAPTWHVCSLGGHVMPMQGAMSHEHTERFPRSKSGALICFCAPHHREPPTLRSATWNGRKTHDASCLALLLAAMPALRAAPFETRPALRLSFGAWNPERREFPARQLIRTFLGRGPPA